MIWTLIETFRWLIEPSITPWLGMIAAAAAGIAARDRRDWRHPARWLSAAVRSVIVWTVMVIFLASLWQLGSGDGNRGAGSGSRETPDSEADETGDAIQTASDGTVGRSTVETMQDTFAVDADITIAFVASPANESITQPFACDILVRQTVGQKVDQAAADDSSPAGFGAAGKAAASSGLASQSSGRRVQIRAVDMQQFESAIVTQLRQIVSSADDSSQQPLSVSVRQEPFPGRPALELVADKVRGFGSTLKLVARE